MKWISAVQSILIGSVAVQGFTSPAKPSVRPSSQLQAQNENKHFSFGTAVAAAVAGWSLATQVVFAGALPQNNVDHSMAGYGSSIEIAAKTETMDFSMPSYDSFSDDSSKAKKTEGAPSFNPFGDFQPGFVDTSSKVEEPKPSPAEDKEAKAAAKAAAEAEAAAKKAEKEARLKAEKEKQEAAAAARAKAAAEAPAPALPAPEIKLPEVDIKAPDLSGLKIDVPKVDIPKFDAPKFDMPKFEAPKVDIPKFDSPKLDIPKFDPPPSVSVPKVDIPQVSLPKVSVPFSGGGSSKPSSDVSLAPREVRDENARQAKAAFADADQAAKEIEQQAREARNFANSKKQAFKDAKDLACADRPGGKFLCIRNPFSTGF